MELVKDDLEKLSIADLEALLIEEKRLELQCDTIQLGLKITLNSCYGYLGNEYSRFYNIDMAEAITLNGQLSNRWIQRKINAFLKKFLRTDTKDFVIMGDSVVGDSKLIVNDDYVEIQQLFGRVDAIINGKEYYYPENLSTLTYDEKTHKTCYKKVNYVVRHKVNKKMFKTSITNKQSITTTSDHSLITYVNTQQRKNGESVFKETKPHELNGDSLIHLANIPRVGEIESKNYPTYIYELLGFYLADGSKDDLNIALSVGSQDVDEISLKLFDKLVNGGYSTSYKTRPNGHDVRIYGKKILDITTCCYNDIGKCVPKFLKHETVENISSFLRGYFTGDGTSLPSNVSVCSVDENIILDIKLLMYYCGVSSTYFKESTENSYNGVYSGTYSHKLTVKGDFTKIGFLLDRKNDKIPKFGKQKKHFDKLGYEFDLSRVLSCDEVFDYDDYVYDVEIADTHTFFANDILVHNTDSCYITLTEFAKKLPTDDKLKIVKAIDKFCKSKIMPIINDGYDELANRINAFQQKMIMEREVIADRAVVRAKKNYCLNVYNSEGIQYDTPKLKVMGLESARSSTPEICRDAFNETLKFIMTSDESTTQAYIAKFKKEFMSADVEDISFPRGINDIDKWTLDNQKLGQFMKKTPIHVKGALTYNVLLDQHDLTQYEPIRMGTKVKFVYLKPENIARNNVISFSGILPKEFGLHNQIDRNLQFSKTYLDPITTILDLAKWTATPTKSLSSFFG